MSSLVRITADSAIVEPVALADMKNFLRIPPAVTNDDALINGMIKAARIQAEVITEVSLVRAQFVQYMDHFPYWRIRDRGYFSGQLGHAYETHNQRRGEIKLKRGPLVSVQKLVFIGIDGDQYTLNPGQDFVVDPAHQPGRIRPIPYTVWPLTLPTENAVAITFTAGYAPNQIGIADGQTGIAEPETLNSVLSQPWKPTTAQPQYSFLIDSNGNVEVQTTAGNPSTGTGPTPPTWPAIGSTVVDGGCTWQNYGPVRGFWSPVTQFSGNCVIVDYNNNLQLLIVPTLISQPAPPEEDIDGEVGLNGIQQPVWATTIGNTTVDDGIVAWRCLGPYNALGNQLLSVPQSPEQQAAVVVDWTLPETVTIAIMQLVTHWHRNREPVTPSRPGTIPLHVESLLATVANPDYAPSPDY